MSPLLQHRMQARSQARPEAVALVFGESRLTYGEVDQASDQLAGLIVSLGCGRGDRVALLMPKAPMAIVAMLATLKAGAIYVPLDPAGPASRLALMLAAIECRVVLTAGKVAPMLEQALAAAKLRRRPLIGWLDTTTWSSRSLRPAFDLYDTVAHAPVSSSVAAACSDSDPALILFTSGSTGQPKGVTITHRNVLSFLGWAIPHFGITSTDRLSQHAPLRFDISTFDIYGALSTGAQLHLVPPELNVLPHKLAQFIRDGQLTQWFCVPSVLNLMAQFDAVRQRDFATLRRVLFAGEVLPTRTLIHWMRRLPHAKFSNLYGPTETTIASSCHTLARSPSDNREPIPIGRPCDSEEFLVLDDKLQPVAAGERGELYIRGGGVSAGYWRDPQRTQAAFVTLPGSPEPGGRAYKTGDLVRQDTEGVFYYLGRADNQVKSRGYRIELGDIESALLSLPSVRDAAVVAIEAAGFEGKLLCCAYVPAPGRRVKVGDVRKELAALLPAHMLPSRWMCHDALPTNASGKTDRLLLAQGFLLAESRPADSARAPSRKAGPRASGSRPAAMLAPTTGEPPR